MKGIKILASVFIVFLMIACGAPKVLTTSKSDAAAFENTGNFTQAISAWESYFNETEIETISGADFAQAAKTAFKVNDLAKSKAWFDQARYKNYADKEMYTTLAEIYRAEDNLSKELSALETYTEKFGSDNAAVKERLFAIYHEIKLSDKALKMWKQLDAEAMNSEANLQLYFDINKSLKNESVCDSLATTLLDLNAENIPALEWMAKKYYWAGQNRYKSEMAKYEKKKTNKTYKALLKELDLVTADFKKALPYLNKLWELNPGKEYAGYLANIYALFGDKKKTNFYKGYRE